MPLMKRSMGASIKEGTLIKYHPDYRRVSLMSQCMAEKCDVLLLVGHPDTSATQRLAVLVSRRGKPVI